jgi:hypothetical protein
MLIIAGTGNGSDEDLRINLDDTANTAVFTSATGVTVANFSGIALQESGASVLNSGEIDTSAELLAIVTDETGTGPLVFSNAPAFSGTATFSALTATSTLTLSGTAANIALGSNFLSNDGGDEGVSVETNGDVVLTGASGNELYISLNEGSGYPTLFGSGDVVSFESHAEIGAGFGLSLYDLGNDRSAYIEVEDNGATVFGNSAGDLALLPASNVGIGTSTPSQKLTVAGNVRITGALYDSNNSAGTSGYVLQSTGTGQQWVATSSLGFSSGGLTATDIDTSAELLAIVGDETGTGALVFGTSPTFTTQITTPLVVGGTATTQDLTFQTTSGVGATGADMHFLVGNNGATEAMTILNNGAIGIGNTAPTNALLTVGAVTQVSGSSTAVLYGVADDNSGFYRPNWNTIGIATNGVEAMRITDGGTVTIGTTTSPAWFNVQTSGSVDILNLFEAGGERVFTVRESGLVGIGDATPSQLLDIDGTNAQALIEESTTEFMRLGVGETAETSVIGWDDADSLQLGVYSSPTDITIDTKMSILSSGFVGIGTTAPTRTLDIVGTA